MRLANDGISFDLEIQFGLSCNEISRRLVGRHLCHNQNRLARLHLLLWPSCTQALEKVNIPMKSTMCSGHAVHLLE